MDALRRVEHAIVAHHNQTVRDLCEKLGHTEAAEEFMLSVQETIAPSEVVSKIESERIQAQLELLFKKRKAPSMMMQSADTALVEMEDRTAEEPPNPPPSRQAANTSLFEVRKCIALVAIELNICEFASSI